MNTPRSSKYFGIAVFILLVTLSGSVLAATGNFNNPFWIFMQTTHQRDALITREAGEEPPVDSGSFQAEERGEGSISWSNIGGVLFNVWFLFAVTAVIIVIQYPLRLVMKFIRRRIKPAVPA